MHHAFRPLRIATALVVGALVCAPAQALTEAEKAFVGEYRGGSVDTVAQLALLDDNTFCFAFMGGSLDLLAAGRWKAEGQGIRLQQVRPEKTAFVVLPGRKEAQGGMVELDFHGHTLSNARAPAVAWSADDKPPATLRPLFGKDQNSWSEIYKLPPVPLAQARYLYLGDVTEPAPGKPVEVQVVQYRLEAAGSVLVAFDEVQAMPLLTPHAVFKGDVLYLEGDRMGKRRPLAAEAVDEARTACIQPALAPKDGAAAQERSGKTLVPAKAFKAKPSAIQGKPYFEAKGG
ncbi:hypothetical protein HNP48_000767 [Acidovorax soli]|uniref:Uncharacterized protein n=1 Tax=Acidovorax soli TaxID=592050 RepID=A0A7X0U7M1_9BURK|nr:hypothetical protein [Acidovorax soli]MBB6558103.1 hypothetical protein [Acidovorax soli]